MLTINVTKFDDDPLKNIQITERTRLILAILDNSRAITPKCFIGSGCLSNLVAAHVHIIRPVFFKRAYKKGENLDIRRLEPEN